MKIAFISTVMAYPWGGSDALWTQAAEAANEKGHALLLAVNAAVARHPRITALCERGAQLLVRPALDPSRSILSRARRAYFPPPDPVLAAIREAKPDLVIFNFGGSYDLALEPAWCEWALSSQIPFRIIVNHQDERPWLSPDDYGRIRSVFQAASRVFFLSERNREITGQHLLSALPNARVVHNALRWKPNDVTPWPSTAVWRFATVARLEPIKGLDLLLHAARRALPSGNSWELHLHGVGPQQDYLVSAATHLGLADRIHFHGFVSELKDIWSQNHILVSPALSEGGPLTLPETLLCGRPVIATRVGIAEEWIHPRQNGFLAASARVSHLEETLREAWELRYSWEEMGRAGAKRILHDYRFNDFQTVVQ